MTPVQQLSYQKYVAKTTTDDVVEDNSTTDVPAKTEVQPDDSLLASPPNQTMTCLSITNFATPKQPSVSLTNSRSLGKATQIFEKWLGKAEIDARHIAMITETHVLSIGVSKSNRHQSFQLLVDHQWPCSL
ncbi:hypothetical protein CROQUDRAFT_88662 [Cronartium quercuum f. sp. fusiforme G11]|uniref:Uncharacterized protein n=1 Tax=Cronartium quercuum f. sp. fusiforme G11 TaxID=708437 RepID=A0A9P6NUP4_9BASI|nr:hypothetical protein CROQUDRAFT_88662 [Cronartium quercuum f. sp. fusiforme G11]